MTETAHATPGKGRLIEYVSDAEYDEVFSDEESMFNDFRNSLDNDDAMPEIRVSRVPDHLAENSRIHPTQAQSYYVFSVPVDLYTYTQLLETIRKEYGGGLYRLICTKKGQKGNAFNRLVRIASRQDSEGKKSESEIGQVLDIMHRMQRETHERMEQFFRTQYAANPAQASSDPLLMIQKFAEVFQALNGVKPQTDFMGELEKMHKVKELLGWDGPQNGGGEANFYSMLSSVVQNLGQPLAHAMAALPAPSNNPAQVQASGNSPAPVRRKSIQEKPTVTGPYEHLRPTVNSLVAEAKNVADPQSVAIAVLDRTPECYYEQLLAFINRDDCLAVMASLNAAVNAHTPWFESLREGIRLQFEPDSSENEQESAAVVSDRELTNATGASDDSAVTGDT